MEEYCHICSGVGYEIGRLGMVTYYRCRQCGMDFNKVDEEDPKKDDKK